VGDFPELHLTEVDGVPLVWADVPGPLAAGLVLRVGQADEPVHLRGVTHLLEHLVADAIGLDGVEAQVHLARTEFTLTGPHRNVAADLSRLCALLAAPPFERLETERRILRVEDAPSPGSEALLLVERYGYRGPGLVYLPELGLRGVDATTVGTWAGEHFRAGSAVAWLAGTPPADLRLALPPGTAPPVARRPGLRKGLRLPAQAATPRDEVALGAVLPAGPATVIFAALLRRRVRDRLRRRLGLIYSWRVGLSHMGDGETHLHVRVDAMHGFGGRTRDELLAVVDGVAANRPSDEELTSLHRELAVAFADGSPHALVVAARLRLDGHDRWRPEEVLADMAAVTPDEVGDRARAALDGALVLVPEGTAPGRWPTSEWGLRIPAPRGRRFALEETPAAGHHVVGDDVLAWVDGDLVTAVTRERAVAVVLEHGDGIAVIGDDGTQVAVPSTDRRGAREVVALVERAFAGVPVVTPEPRFAPPATVGRSGTTGAGNTTGGAPVRFTPPRTAPSFSPPRSRRRPPSA
jgi:hypothetical protein